MMDHAHVQSVRRSALAEAVSSVLKDYHGIYVIQLSQAGAEERLAMELEPELGG